MNRSGEVPEQYEQAARGHQLLRVAQTLAQIPGRVENVGGQNQVIRIGTESLIHRGARSMSRSS